MKTLRGLFAVFSIGLLSLAPATLRADGVFYVLPPTIHGDIVSIPGMGSFQMVTPLQEYEVERGKWKLKGGFTQMGILNGTANMTIEEIEFDPDPTILFNMSWQNATTTFQTYSFNLTIPALFNVSPNMIYGAITTQVIDHGTDGATVAAPAGMSIYNALIDGTPVQTMQSDPFSIVAAPMGVANGLQTFGWIGNNLPVTTSIGITLNFTLSPGDTAAFLARFDVVPEPGTGALLALGLGALALVRRRA